MAFTRQEESMKRHAFTLVELLVVIGILTLLAAILFPALSRVREKGRSAVCVSNLHQLGLALQMYVQDYDRYPHAVDPADKYAPQIWKNRAMAQGFDLNEIGMLTDVMEPYVKSSELWHCPSDVGFDRPDSIPYQLGGEPTRPSCFAKYGTSYFYRTELMFRNLSPDRLNDPAKVNVLFDAHGDWHGGGVLGPWSEKRYNVLFADGHVKTRNWAQMSKTWSTSVQ